jgi:hypothetical protein
MAEVDMGPRKLGAIFRAGAQAAANQSRRDRLSLVGISDQCRVYSKGTFSDGPAAQAEADRAYDGITADDAPLGIMPGIVEEEVPDRF